MLGVAGIAGRSLRDQCSVSGRRIERKERPFAREACFILYVDFEIPCLPDPESVPAD